MIHVALVTGASTGIGRSLARQLADQGAKVACVARRGDLLDELAAEIRDHGGTAFPIVADVRDREAIHAAVAKTERDLGPIDLLIANAGIGQTIPAEAFDAAVFDDTIRTNLMGTVYAVEAVLPSMLRRGAGQIAGISSLAGYRGLPETHAYCASKAAMNSFLEGLRAEVRPRGIFVTTICPGFIRTPMTSKNKHPMPFLLEPEEAARRILKAIRAKRRVYNFPLPMAAFTKLVHFLPVGLVDRIVGKDKWFD